MTRPYIRPTKRQRELLAALLVTGDLSVAASRIGITIGSAHVYMTRMHARTGLTTEQVIHAGTRDGWIGVHEPEREMALQAP